MPLLVFSHLRWDFVYQRPQHLLSRIARTRRVLFLEEPVHEPDAVPRLDITQPCPGVHVARPVTGSRAAGYHAEQLALLEPLLLEWLEREGVDEYVAWFYTPMALPLLEVLSPRAVVYDCMDELSAFSGAPPQMRQREASLFDRTDLVLTGGRPARTSFGSTRRSPRGRSR
jgi:hypothetical protein